MTLELLRKGFGGQFMRHIGAYDDPVSRLLYGFYTVLMPRYLDLLRARHRRRGVLKHEWHEGTKGTNGVGSWRLEVTGQRS